MSRKSTSSIFSIHYFYRTRCNEKMTWWTEYFKLTRFCTNLRNNMFKIQSDWFSAKARKLASSVLFTDLYIYIYIWFNASHHALRYNPLKFWTYNAFIKREKNSTTSHIVNRVTVYTLNVSWSPKVWAAAISFIQSSIFRSQFSTSFGLIHELSAWAAIDNFPLYVMAVKDTP